jgi:hypothetical protein
MLILDALRRSKSPQEIDFLLTCYLEGLQFYAVATQLPAAVMVSPVRGLDDAEGRLLSLRDARHLADGVPRESDRAIINEVTEVFSVAVSCLAGHARRNLHSRQTRRGRRSVQAA